jgi:hypothetical protein
MRALPSLQPRFRVIPRALYPHCAWRDPCAQVTGTSRKEPRMAAELHTLDDLSRLILHALFDRWYTTDDVKSAAMLTAAEIAAVVGRPEATVRDHMLLLETTGYVLTQRVSSGGDPTLQYKRVDEAGGGGDDPDRIYTISDTGKQFVAADALGAEPDDKPATSSA